MNLSANLTTRMYINVRCETISQARKEPRPADTKLGILTTTPCFLSKDYCELLKGCMNIFLWQTRMIHISSNTSANNMLPQLRQREEDAKKDNQITNTKHSHDSKAGRPE